MVISVLHYKLLENTYLYVFTICLSFPRRIFFRRHNVLESVTLYYFENKLETSYGWKFSLLSEHPHPFSESWKWQHRSKYRKNNMEVQRQWLSFISHTWNRIPVESLEKFQIVLCYSWQTIPIQGCFDSFQNFQSHHN